MSKEKQIEEMAKTIDEESEFHILGVNDAFIKVKVACERVAEKLYNAGYRKQSECDLVEVANWAGSIEYKCTACKEGFFHAEYYQYCPFCGAKKKGGVE